MKFSIAKKDLVSAVMPPSNAAAKKPSMPVLACIKIDVVGDVVTFTGTDLFVGSRVHTPCSTKVPGSVAVPAKQFADACRALPDGEVSIRLDDKKVELKCGKTKHLIPWQPANEYPALPECSETTAVQATSLAACIASVAHAMYCGDDPGRANTAGAHLALSDCRCEASAGTGQVIAHRNMECASGAKFSVLIPHRAIADVRRVLDVAKDGDVGIAVDGGTIFFVHGNVTLSVKLVGESFPDLKRFFERGYEKRPTFAREMAIDEVKRVMVGAADEFSHVDFAVGDGAMTITAKSGESSSAIDIDYAGEPFVVRMPGGAVISALSALTHNEVAMQVKGVLDPVYFVPAEGVGQLQIIAPAAVA